MGPAALFVATSWNLQHPVFGLFILGNLSKSFRVGRAQTSGIYIPLQLHVFLSRKSRRSLSFLVSFFSMAFSKRTGKFRKCGGGMSPFFRQHERAIRGRMLRILTDLIQRGFGSRLPKQSSITGYEIAFCKGWPPSGRLLLKIGATSFVWTLFYERAPPSVFGK